MIDEDKIRNTVVTVAAMKMLLGRLYALYYKQLELDPELVPEMHKSMIANWEKRALVISNDPAISDMMSDEVLRELERFLQGVEKDFLAME